jgi:uncharacterized membrane protein
VSRIGAVSSRSRARRQDCREVLEAEKAVAAVVGLAGIAVVNGLLHTPRATVAWIALVVGLHFFGLAIARRRPALRWLGAAMAACGAAGFVCWGIHRAD